MDPQLGSELFEPCNYAFCCEAIAAKLFSVVSFILYNSNRRYLAFERAKILNRAYPCATSCCQAYEEADA